jgi:hypothetical protein
VLPTDEYFPGRYDATEAHGRALVARVCEYMGVDPGTIQIHFFREGRPPLITGAGMQSWEGKTGSYHRGSFGEVIQLEAEALRDPLTLAAVAAHQLALTLLYDQPRDGADVDDLGEMADLLAVLLGMGVFIANSRVRSAAWNSAGTESFQIRRLGGLTQPVTGYALALFAYVRGEENPAWARHVCADVRAPLQAGLRYLRKTGDCLYDPAERAFRMLSDDSAPPGYEGRGR